MLLLTGAIMSAKQGVDEFAGSFDCFSFLWLKDLAGEYAAFLATNPNLEVRALHDLPRSPSSWHAPMHGHMH